MSDHEHNILCGTSGSEHYDCRVNDLAQRYRDVEAGDATWDDLMAEAEDRAARYGTRDMPEHLVAAHEVKSWSREEHDAQCANSGCPGYEYHRYAKRDPLIDKIEELQGTVVDLKRQNSLLGQQREIMEGALEEALTLLRRVPDLIDQRFEGKRTHTDIEAFLDKHRGFLA